MSLEAQRRVWPTEDYQLARSLVPDVRHGDHEDDLFAGMRAGIDATAAHA